jgi:hypothetical protein
MNSQGVPAEKRADWREWAVREFGDDPRSVELATDSVLKSLIAGYSVEQSVAIARAAVVAGTSGTDANASRDEADTRLAAAEHPVSDAEHLRGQVSLFRTRTELMGTQYGTLWNFRVDSWDREGKPQPAVAVEMRGLQFNGSVGDGDWVDIPGPWEAGENLRINRLRNITMNAPVIVDDDSGTSSGEARRDAGNAVPRKTRFMLALAAIVPAVALVILSQGRYLGFYHLLVVIPLAVAVIIFTRVRFLLVLAAIAPTVALVILTQGRFFGFYHWLVVVALGAAFIFLTRRRS